MERENSNPEGGCACGAVRYRLASAPMFVHCCQRRRSILGWRKPARPGGPI